MKKRLSSISLVAFLLCFTLPLGAQQYYNNFCAGGCSSNLFPLASATNRVQWIYPPTVFKSSGTTGTPAPIGLITKIYFQTGSTVNAGTQYANFTISLGQNIGSTTTFANSTFLGGLTQVFYQNNFTLTGVQANTWYGITLQNPFVYDPNQSLVFEMMSQNTVTGNYVSQIHGTYGAQRNWGTYGTPTGAAASPNTGLVNFGFDIINLAPPNATGGGVFCVGDNVTLTATSTIPMANPKFWWTGPGGFSDTNATITFNNVQIANAGNYYVRTIGVLFPGGPIDTSNAALVNITVNPIPGKPVVPSIITYCQGDPFDSIQIYGENLKWYTVPTGGTAGPYPKLNTAEAGTVTYYVSQTVDGCEGPRAQLTLSVAPKPAPPQVTSPIGYCQGVPASPLIAQGQNVRWYSTPTGGVGTPIAPTPSTGAQGTVTWYATQTVAGCESKRAPVVVNVSYLPNGLITLGRDFVCQYDTITIGYFGNALPSADYTWTLPEGAQIVSGTGAGPLVIRFDSFGTQRVRLVVDNAGCIGPEAYYDVPVQISPRLTIDMPDNVCAGEIVNLGITYSTPGIDSFIWDFAGAEMMYGSVPRGPFGLKWQSGGEKTVTVIAIDNTCKSLPSFDQILVRDLPNSNITASRTDICAGDSIEFSVPVEPGGSYQWLPHQFFGESNSNQVWGVVDVAKEIKVNVTSIYNCKSTGSLWVGAQPCCEVYFPTAFTPNGDGKNDVFRMLTVNKDKNAQTKAHTITAFRVVNRWGQTVFETGDETTGWDGSFNGKPADMGTYFFYVKYKCADGNFYEERGEVTLVR